MSLNEKDLKLTEMYISQFEKTTAMWRWTRWVILSVSIMLLCSVPYLAFKAGEIQELNSKELILKGADLNNEMVDDYIDVKIDLLRAELSINMKMIFNVLFGGAMLGLVIGSWGQEKRQQVIISALRTILAISSDQNASNQSLDRDAPR